jgi:hypothetical protein
MCQFMIKRRLDLNPVMGVEPKPLHGGNEKVVLFPWSHSEKIIKIVPGLCLIIWLH